jgi:hypothetical protein
MIPAPAAQTNNLGSGRITSQARIVRAWLALLLGTARLCISHIAFSNPAGRQVALGDLEPNRASGLGHCLKAGAEP